MLAAAMIDLHTHILSGLDDGAQDLEESLELARVAVADGVEAVVATPHADERFEETLPLYRERLAELTAALAAAGCPLRVVPGCEAYLTLDVGARAASGAYPTIGGSRYLLVEWPLQQYPAYADQALFDLRLKGFRPLVAHAERYRAVQSNVNMLVALIERGGLVQVTAMSLLGGFGPEAQRTAEVMLEHGLAHVLASDAHSPTARPPLLSAGRERAAQLVGAAAARTLVEETPRAIVAGQPVEPPEPRPYRRRPFWAFWR